MNERSTIDPDHGPRPDPIDTPGGVTDDGYAVRAEADMGRDNPSGTVDARPGDRHPPQNPALPPENGRRASFDPRTGEVHGSGSGAGGGNPGEDFESDPAGGDGYPITAGEGGDERAPSDLGPTRTGE